MSNPENDAVVKLRDIVTELSRQMRCNCDLDNWQPEKSTGHSHVCRIHKAAIERVYRT